MKLSLMHSNSPFKPEVGPKPAIEGGANRKSGWQHLRVAFQDMLLLEMISLNF
jgi:hypothetical protein